VVLIGVHAWLVIDVYRLQPAILILKDHAIVINLVEKLSEIQYLLIYLDLLSISKLVKLQLREHLLIDILPHLLDNTLLMVASSIGPVLVCQVNALEELALQFNDLFNQYPIVLLLSPLASFLFLKLILMVSPVLLQKDGVLGVCREKVNILNMLLGQCLYFSGYFIQFKSIIPKNLIIRFKLNDYIYYVINNVTLILEDF
jgi:hypothetical protein